MDQWKTDEDALEPSPHRQSDDVEVNEAVTARKVLKADREKLRRDKLNEQFQDLGNVLDPDRPKNDKGSILIDAIQVLKDLNSEVKKLKAEHAVLCEESCELTQEKNELREEKVYLKSDIQNLKAQHHQSQRFMVPWATVDSPIVMAPPYSFPVALPVPPGTVSMHPTIQPLPFLANQHSATPSPCSTFIPYLAPVIPRIDQPTTLNVSTSYMSEPRNSRGRSFDEQRSIINKIVDNSNDVATDLELKIPGSTALKEFSTREKGKRPERQQEKSVTNGSCSSKSSLHVFHGSSDSVDEI